MTAHQNLRPVDIATDPHLHGVFAPIVAESDLPELAIEGELPIEMDGLFLRNGPNPRFTPLGSYIYPLEGDAMVHGLWVSDGRARYANRFVHTPALDPDDSHGWWITYAIDRTSRASSALVIPAADPASGPVARVHIPTRVPLGLHGAWLPTEE